MRSIFCRIIWIQFYFNQKIFESIDAHQEQISQRLKELWSHTASVHSIWFNKIVLLDKSPEPWDTLDLKELIKIDKTNFESSISLIDNFDLDSDVSYLIGNGNTYINSVHDILFQKNNHSTYHRRQIAVEFKYIMENH